jgi:hypothetical protein
VIFFTILTVFYIQNSLVTLLLNHRSSKRTPIQTFDDGQRVQRGQPLGVLAELLPPPASHLGEGHAATTFRRKDVNAEPAMDRYLQSLYLPIQCYFTTRKIAVNKHVQNLQFFDSKRHFFIKKTIELITLYY